MKYPSLREEPLLGLVMLGQTFVVPAFWPVVALIGGITVVRPVLIAWSGQETSIDVGIDVGFEVSVGLNILLSVAVITLAVVNKGLRSSVKSTYRLSMLPMHRAPAPEIEATPERHTGDGAASSGQAPPAGDDDVPGSDTPQRR